MEYFFVYLALLAKSCEIFTVVKCLESVKEREKRYLVYPPPGVGNAPTKVQLIIGLGLPMEGGLIVGYVVKHNYNLPYNATFYTDPYVRYERSLGEERFKKKHQGSITRWETYKMFESGFGIFGSGKSCLLRAICEAAGSQFNENHGLLGELLHVFFTPSTTDEEFLENEDQEYIAAESLGRKSPQTCKKFSSDCETSPLEYFTETEN
ncbi:uncharacterized protein LOC105686955 [Athalia rosae]|uniref:uncharacterized protein LOC105686955 n=1 Tax=Athalia rosae TaxID=37344 RepID=UPI0020341355|nr:uncharacterized protein LOC105686955 [Athalia rosae]